MGQMEEFGKCKEIKGLENTEKIELLGYSYDDIKNKLCRLIK